VCTPKRAVERAPGAGVRVPAEVLERVGPAQDRPAVVVQGMEVLAVQGWGCLRQTKLEKWVVP